MSKHECIKSFRRNRVSGERVSFSGRVTCTVFKGKKRKVYILTTVSHREIEQAFFSRPVQSLFSPLSVRRWAGQFLYRQGQLA